MTTQTKIRTHTDCSGALTQHSLWQSPLDHFLATSLLPTTLDDVQLAAILCPENLKPNFDSTIPESTQTVANHRTENLSQLDLVYFAFLMLVVRKEDGAWKWKWNFRYVAMVGVQTPVRSIRCQQRFLLR